MIWYLIYDHLCRGWSCSNSNNKRTRYGSRFCGALNTKSLYKKIKLAWMYTETSTDEIIMIVAFWLQQKNMWGYKITQKSVTKMTILKQCVSPQNNNRSILVKACKYRSFKSFKTSLHFCYMMVKFCFWYLIVVLWLDDFFPVIFLLITNMVHCMLSFCFQEAKQI